MLTLLHLLSSIALLVWGTHIVRTGSMRVYGSHLRRLLGRSMGHTPLAFGAADGYLPGYLSEAIEFERGEMPEFIGRMLGVLNQVAAEHVAPRA